MPKRSAARQLRSPTCEPAGAGPGCASARLEDSRPNRKALQRPRQAGPLVLPYGSAPRRSATPKSNVLWALLCSDTAMARAGPSFRVRIAPSRSTETVRPPRTAAKYRFDQLRIILHPCASAPSRRKMRDRVAGQFGGASGALVSSGGANSGEVIRAPGKSGIAVVACTNRWQDAAH
jgi:hypothetical protein